MKIAIRKWDRICTSIEFDEFLSIELKAYNGNEERERSHLSDQANNPINCKLEERKQRGIKARINRLGRVYFTISLSLVCRSDLGLRMNIPQSFLLIYVPSYWERVPRPCDNLLYGPQLSSIWIWYRKCYKENMHRIRVVCHVLVAWWGLVTDRWKRPQTGRNNCFVVASTFCTIADNID